jgi:hypothetical protein
MILDMMTDTNLTLDEFITAHGVTATSTPATANPHMKDDGYPMNHFRVTLQMGSARMTLHFSQGPGIKESPSASSVLSCLASDSASVENARSFEEWASDLGYDTDSSSAEKTFKACEKQAAKLKTFLGDDLYELLLWGVDND